jgi:EH_Signature domain
MLADLSAQLARAVNRLATSVGPLGQPELVQRSVEATAELFQNSAKALPSKEDTRVAAIGLLRGKTLDDHQMDMVAGVLCDPVGELGGIRPIGKAPVLPLFALYKKQVEEQKLPRLTWYGLLNSYFKFDPATASSSDQKGWQFLRSFLKHTWPLIDRESGSGAVPDWVRVLRGDAEILGDKAANRYALDYLQGDKAPVHKLASDLGIPESSWYWQHLVLAAVHRATSSGDGQFKSLIPKLLSLIQERPVYRDEALIAILTRYYTCQEKPTHDELREYVTRKDVWRNPKLKAAGIATSWNRVSDDVWRMALKWVNEGNLRDFFQILAARNRQADEGRLAFWTKYMKQIRWARLIFGQTTMNLARSNRAIRDLIAGEEDAYARISGVRELDAFMMEIGDYIIVEFSITGNAAYVYKSDDLQFDRYASNYQGNTSDLKYGFVSGAKARIVHHAPWEQDAAGELRRLGIHPDSAGYHPSEPAAPHVARTAPPQAAATPRETPAGASSMSREASAERPASRTARSYLPNAPRGASFEMDRLYGKVSSFDGASIDDLRKPDGTGGRLWVHNPRQDIKLEKMLKDLGFEWAASRSSYYFRERP